MSNGTQIAIVTVLSVAVLLFFFYTATQKQSQKTTGTIKIQTQTTSNETPTDFQSTIRQQAISDPFYRTIIDNNLFRPLGWRQPHPRYPYRLLGTLIPTGSKTPRQAIIEVIASKHTLYRSIGDKLDAETTVIDIQPKAVRLEKNGHQRNIILNTAPWIK